MDSSEESVDDASQWLGFVNMLASVSGDNSAMDPVVERLLWLL